MLRIVPFLAGLLLCAASAAAQPSFQMVDQYRRVNAEAQGTYEEGLTQQDEKSITATDLGPFHGDVEIDLDLHTMDVRSGASQNSEVKAERIYANGGAGGSRIGATDVFTSATSLCSIDFEVLRGSTCRIRARAEVFQLSGSVGTASASLALRTETGEELVAVSRGSVGFEEQELEITLEPGHYSLLGNATGGVQGSEQYAGARYEFELSSGFVPVESTTMGGLKSRFRTGSE